MPPVCRLSFAFAAGRSELVENLIDPEALQAGQRLVEAIEFLVAKTADLVDGLKMTIIEFVDDFGHFLAFRRQLDTNRPAIGTRALLEDVAGFNQFLEIVRYVGAEIV